MKIEYVGELFNSNGYGEATRNMLALFDKAGLDVSAVNLHGKGREDHSVKDGWEYKVVKAMENKFKHADIRIIHMVASFMNRLHKKNGYNIGYMAWEADLLPSDWTYQINTFLDEVWVPCNHNKRVMEHSGVRVPIEVMPPTVFSEDLTSDHTMTKETKDVFEHIDMDKFNLYSIFQWVERKAPDRLLMAYYTEFDVDEDIILNIRSNRANDSEDEIKGMLESIQLLQAELAFDPKRLPAIKMFPTRVPQNTISNFHKHLDCFVLAHRGEGWGHPLMDAFLHDNPVITSRLGGPEDFIPEDYSLNLEYTMVPARNRDVLWGAKNYMDGHMKWGEPSIASLRKRMRHVYELWKANDFDQLKEEAKQVHSNIENTYSPEENSKRIHDILGRVEQRLRSISK